MRINHRPGGTIERHSLSQPYGLPAPSEREPGNVPIQPGTCETVGLRAIFIAPTKTQKFLHFTIHRTTLPQSALAGCQLPQRGSRDGLHHSTGYSLKSGVAGDFHRPYGTQKFLHFTVQQGYPMSNSANWVLVGSSRMGFWAYWKLSLPSRAFTFSLGFW